NLASPEIRDDMDEFVCCDALRASPLSEPTSRHCLHGAENVGALLHETGIPLAGIAYPSMTSSTRWLSVKCSQNLLERQKTRPSPSASSTPPHIGASEK